MRFFFFKHFFNKLPKNEYYGIGESENDEKAFEYYKKAVEQGCAGAQHLSGRSFDAGVGTDVNLKEAKNGIRKLPIKDMKEMKRHCKLCKIKKSVC